jgi:hypothetical protein
MEEAIVKKTKIGAFCKKGLDEPHYHFILKCREVCWINIMSDGFCLGDQLIWMRKTSSWNGRYYLMNTRLAMSRYVMRAKYMGGHER